MIRQLIFIFGLGLPSTLLAGNYNYPVGARSASLAYASVSLTDLWSSFNNQAGLAWLRAPSIGFHYENRFLVKEYALHAGVFAMPLKPGTGALSYRYFGYSKYHESKIGLAFARKFSKSFSAGVQLNYHQTYLAEGYGIYNALSVEVGLIFKPVENLSIGVHAFNPNRAHSNVTSNEYIPTVFRLGAGYNLLGKAALFFETEKDLDLKPVYKGGIEVKAIENLDLRIGLSTGYMEYTFGVGYHGQLFEFDLAFSHHNILGYTPQASVLVNLSRKK
jgi:hypothetical protein